MVDGVQERKTGLTIWKVKQYYNIFVICYEPDPNVLGLYSDLKYYCR